MEARQDGAFCMAFCICSRNNRGDKKQKEDALCGKDPQRMLSDQGRV